MALAINNEPGNFVSVNNEMLFTVYEDVKAIDPVTYVDYTYICDVYIDNGATFIGRLTARPEPEYNRGVFDVAPLLRSFVTYGLKANYSSVTEYYTNKINYQLKFGEEYNATTYTNVLEDVSDRSAFKTYVGIPFERTDIIDEVDELWASNIPTNIYSTKDIKWQIIPYTHNISGDTTITLQFNDGSNNVGSPYTITSYPTKDQILQTNCGFEKIATALGLTQSEKDSVTRLLVDSNVNNIVFINYVCSKYPLNTLVWLNPYGGYDSYSFNLVSKKTEDLTRKSFQKLPYQLNASGEVSYSADGVFYGGKKGFGTMVKTTLRMTSHILSDEEYTWLAEMFRSPDVYMYSEIQDKFFPVQIMDNNYEHRTYMNSRLKPLEFSVDFGQQYNSQLL